MYMHMFIKCTEQARKDRHQNIGAVAAVDGGLRLSLWVLSIIIPNPFVALTCVPGTKHLMYIN